MKYQNAAIDRGPTQGLGCGACQYHCPVTPTPAMVVHGVDRQSLVEINP